MVAPMVLSQLATGLSVLAGAALVKSVVEQSNPMAEFPRGCRSCVGTGRMACSSCGGSGTGRPIPAQLIIRPPRKS
ncbi:hypothetical protein AgCh_021041 [Apium graveolens]